MHIQYGWLIRRRPVICACAKMTSFWEFLNAPNDQVIRIFFLQHQHIFFLQHQYWTIWGRDQNYILWLQCNKWKI